MGRKVLDDTDLVAFPTPDHSGEKFDFDIPDQVWSGATGNAVSKLLVCYDLNSAGGIDSEIIPMTAHDFVVTPDGSDITAQVAAAGFFSAGE